MMKYYKKENQNCSYNCNHEGIKKNFTHIPGETLFFCGVVEKPSYTEDKKLYVMVEVKLNSITLII